MFEYATACIYIKFQAIARIAWNFIYTELIIRMRVNYLAIEKAIDTVDILNLWKTKMTKWTFKKKIVQNFDCWVNTNLR